MLKNYMEKLVTDCLLRMLEEGGEEKTPICRCPLCVAQMKVNALNRLTPLYLQENTDSLPEEYRRREEEYRLELIQAVEQATQQVGRTAHKNNRQPGAKDMQSLAGLYRRRDKTQ